MKKVALLAGCLFFVSCGGGGGGESADACSSIKISGGESCNAGEPSVAFLTISKSKGTFNCTGTYISQTAILTAAHCIYPRSSSIVVETPGYTRHARAYYIHPQYNREFKDESDLAIVLVSEPIQAAPVSLVVSTSPPGIGEELVAYGYGNDENGRGALGRIANGEAPLKATFIAFAGSLAGGRFYKTASTEEGTTCNGDSGGPILAKNANGEYGIIAVTSFGYETTPAGCDPIAKGTLAVVSPIQNTSAINFILAHAPDAAHN